MLPKEQKQIVREGYDKLSYAYRTDDTADDYENYGVWVRLIVERVPEHSPVLDIGCGCGLPATSLRTPDLGCTRLFGAIWVSWGGVKGCAIGAW